MPPVARAMRLSGWGRYPVAECSVVEPDCAEDLSLCLAERLSGTIARGNGRSYGDASLSRVCTISMKRLDRLLGFDEETGVLTCEGGTLLADIVDLFVPRGWFAPVTPGTRFVTVGGMIASDVHGKNHHGAGSFCEHVIWLDIALGDGSIVRCSHTQNDDLFAATCGGMGLTGVIVRAQFRLMRITTGRIRQTIMRAPTLERAMEIFEENQRSTYSVAWIDCLASGAALGRSVVVLGEHATVDDLPRPERKAPFGRPADRTRRVPLDLPGFALNPLAVRLFNRVYYSMHRPGTAVVDSYRYFYPLDALLDWNRIYGRGGFVQYQCVLPLDVSSRALSELLGAITRAGQGSFLAVLKRLGAPSFGYLSFPMEGYTLALDFPARPATLALLDRLDAIVAANGGRIYLTKDARAAARVVASGYPRLDEFRDVRRRHGLIERFSSLQSQRLEL